MDRRFALVIVGVMLFVIIFLVGCVPSPTPTPSISCVSEKNTWTCPPTADFVTRKVTFTILPQKVGDLEIKARRLPTETIPPPPPEKNITCLTKIVIDPQVLIKGTSQNVSTFDPPFTVTMEFQGEDLVCKASGKTDLSVPRGADGKPQLSIIFFYKDGDTWRWEKLKTQVDCQAPCNQGTLTAVTNTLHPSDQEGEGF